MTRKLQASGQTICAPGSSIVTSSIPTPSSHGLIDAILDKVEEDGFLPPKKQHDFLSNLTTKNTLVNRGAGFKSKILAYPSSLESASAVIPTKTDVFKLDTGSCDWIHMRMQQSQSPVSKSGVVLTPVTKRAKVPHARKSATPLIRHYALRDRIRPALFSEFPPVPTQSFVARTHQSARLGKRKISSEGSAAKPIALDSDTESEAEAKAEVQRQSDSAVISDMKIVDEGMSERKNNATKMELEGKQTVSAFDAIVLHTIAQIANCDVMIGLFQCVVDLFFQDDQMYMKNIRGKYENWPFKQDYLLEYKHLQDVKVYSVSKDINASVEVGVSATDRMRQLLEEVSYIAFKAPMSEETDHAAVSTFYDPSGSDVSKGYMVIRPLEDASGDDLSDIKDILQCHANIQLIDDKEQAKDYLQALMKEPFNYRSSRRSRRRRSDAADTASESDEDGTDGSVIVLTYPLPPCTIDVVTIVRHDVSRLKPRRYLNDNIIDYYFKRMILKTFQNNELVQEKVLCLSSHFYSRLRAGKGSTASGRMEAGYKNVSTWLARSNVFNRSIIFIPINKDLHWSLAVILNPGIAGTGRSDEEAFSCIAVLDPLGSYHCKAAIIRNLRAFLRMQWHNLQEQRLSNSEETPLMSEYQVERVVTLNVKTPLQENSYDCGAYVLKFAEVMLKNCLELGLLALNNGVISKHVTNNHLEALITSNAFSAEDITAIRHEILQYIEVDASKYQIIKKEKASRI
ncbi:unnamed protein product [Peronospora belbahrii]|uniref:Ubiquitin-like protease family profile domain-containing protein n=1 Tax=Peronospora belbahrii TaxID=622444 RepID=A0AAU9LBC7_9STRA|nr:unnamed protein product [Peronospora belbahrii]